MFAWLWNLVHGLPVPVMILVLLLIAFVTGALFVYPLYLMIRYEPVELAHWFRSERDAIREHRAQGLSGAGLYATCVAFAIDTVNHAVGQFIAWFALLMVIDQFVVVIMRYIFNVGLIPMQESIWYCHGILFMMGAGWTLMRDGHVRVDIFYREASPRRKAMVDLFGVVVLLLPLAYVAWDLSWPYVVDSWKVREGSTELTGLPIIYLYKTVILVMLVLLTLQAVALAIRSALLLAGIEKPHPAEQHEGL